MNKKAVMGPVISIFVMILVISILAGLSFLFTTSLKTTSLESSNYATWSILNESFTPTTAGTYLTKYNLLGVTCSIQSIWNGTGPVLDAGNYTIDSNDGCLVYNLTTTNGYDGTWVINYNYSAVQDTNSYTAINDTEDAGSTIIGYLPLIFLALIFGAILTLVLKIILPYINLGERMGGF